jgi:hypothetical protein
MGYIVVVYGRRHQQPQYSFSLFYILFATCSLTLGGAGRDNDGIKGPEIKIRAKKSLSQKWPLVGRVVRGGYYFIGAL